MQGILSPISATLLHDFLYAWRRRLLHPLETMARVLSLALGMGGNIAVLALIYVAIFRPFEYPDSDRLFVITRTGSRQASWEDSRWSYPRAAEVLAGSRVLSGVAVVGEYGVTLATRQGVWHTTAEFTNSDYFRVLGIKLLAGRLYFSGDASSAPTAGAREVIVEETFARRHGLLQLGSTLRVNGIDAVVAGIVARPFRGQHDRTAIWLPLEMAPDVFGNPAMLGDSAWWLSVIGRLPNGVSVAMARARLAQIPTTHGWGVSLVPLRSTYLAPQVQHLILALFGAAGFVLIVACLNVTTLQLADLNKRSLELGIRRCLGATDPRIMLQLTIDNAIDAFIAGALAVLFGWSFLRWAVNEATAIAMSHYATLQLPPIASRPSVWIGSAALTSIIAFLLLMLGTLLPFQGLRTYAPGSSVMSAAGRLRRQTCLVVIQLAICLLCAASASTFARSLIAAHSRFSWPHSADIVTFRIDLLPSRSGERRQLVLDELLNRLHQVPGLRGAAFDVAAPFADEVPQSSMQLQDQPARLVDLHATTPGYFKVMGLRLLAGRDFVEQDGPNAPAVVIVNQAAARAFWPSEQAIGQLIPQILLLNSRGWVSAEVVGVVADAAYGRSSAPPTPALYVPLTQDLPTSLYGFVRRPSPAYTLSEAAIMGIARQIDADAAIYDYMSLSDRVRRATSRERLGVILLSGFGIVAGLLALIGVFALVRFVTVARTKEMAIRLAIGATPTKLVASTMQRATVIGATGTLLGVAGAALSDKLLHVSISGLVALDWRYLLALGLILLVAVVVASLAPALAVLRLDPTAALRSE